MHGLVAVAVRRELERLWGAEWAVDLAEVSATDIAAVLSADTEPELVVIDGSVRAARLVKAVEGESAQASFEAADGTVLVTGGLGELGQALSRHLVTVHGVRHLVLTSRRGEETPRAEALVAELRSLGAQSVRVVACDVSDRDAIANVFDAIPSDHPLTGVFHLAGVLDDGVVTELTADRVARVLRPKVDGAWHLHTLTAGLDLAAGHRDLKVGE